jgi:hypothetical protein
MRDRLRQVSGNATAIWRKPLVWIVLIVMLLMVVVVVYLASSQLTG